MNEQEYRNFYDKVGEEIGWDFSKIKCITEGEKWDFYQKVSQALKTTDLWLDIGIGGGEKVIEISELSHLLIGIDNSEGMIKTAMRNLQNSGKNNIRFIKMDAYDLKFPDEFFDVITTRHCDFKVSEIARLLKKGGYFLTQQVARKDKANFKKFFGRSQSSGEQGLLIDKYANQFKELDFDNVFTDEYDATEYYCGYEDLLFLLKYTPVVSDFGQYEDDFLNLNRFIKENQTEKGIVTNSHRTLLVVRK